MTEEELEALDEQYKELLPDGASFKDANKALYFTIPIPKPTTAEEYAAMPMEEQLQVLKEELLHMYYEHGCCSNTEIEEWLDNERKE